MSYSWTCPFCKMPTTIVSSNETSGTVDCTIDSAMGPVRLSAFYVVCPNTECRKLNLVASLHSLRLNSFGSIIRAGKMIKYWDLIPDSNAKTYDSTIVPQAIIDDYQEACKILSLSPKASATLARRALQGMIRNFWSIKKPEGYKGPWSLKHEIEAIKEKVDPDVWLAIDAVRDVGNIGAHMENDVNVIIDVEPGEAEQLIGLIELLIEEWYINRHARKIKLAAIQKIAEQKKQLKQSTKKDEPTESIPASK